MIHPFRKQSTGEIMKSALGHSTQVFNANVQPFDALTQDVNKIYSKKDRTTKNYVHDYFFEDNKVSIAFERAWKGQAAVCGIDMKGSAEITMQKRDPDLEARIITIIKQPTYATLAGIFPLVNLITIK